MPFLPVVKVAPLTIPLCANLVLSFAFPSIDMQSTKPEVSQSEGGGEVEQQSPNALISPKVNTLW